MNHEHEPPYSAGEVIRDMQSRGLIPLKPPAGPARRHILEAALRVLACACWGIAGLMIARLIVTLIQH